MSLYRSFDVPLVVTAVTPHESSGTPISPTIPKQSSAENIENESVFNNHPRTPYLCEVEDDLGELCNRVSKVEGEACDYCKTKLWKLQKGMRFYHAN